jgi:hypothetical protein
VEELDGFQSHTGFTMPKCPALLPAESCPMCQLSDGMDIITLEEVRKVSLV